MLRVEHKIKVTEIHPAARNFLNLSHFLFSFMALFPAEADAARPSGESEVDAGESPSPSNAENRSQTISIIEEIA